MYWHQGFENANEVIKECVKSWYHLNPDWEIILLDQISVKEYIDKLDVPDDKLQILKIQHQSDLIRTKLLIDYGGVWVDPTCFCVKPLSHWIDELTPSGLFFFNRPGRDRILGNWFIASPYPNNYFLNELYAFLCYYWSNNQFRNHLKSFPRAFNFLDKFINRSVITNTLWFNPLFTKIIRLYPYMIYHYAAYYLIKNNAKCKAIWSQMPKVSALGPPRLQRIGLLNKVNKEAKELIDKGDIPLFKLSWKIDINSIDKNSVINYLFDSYK